MFAFVLAVALQGDLVDRLRSDDLDVRADASARLLAMGVSAIPALERAAGDATADELLRRLRVRAQFGPMLTAAWPDLEAEAERGVAAAWTHAFVLAARTIGEDPTALVGPALRGATDDGERRMVIELALERGLPVPTEALRLLIARRALDYWRRLPPGELLDLLRELILHGSTAERSGAFALSAECGLRLEVLDAAATRLDDPDGETLDALAVPEARGLARRVAPMLNRRDLAAAAIRALVAMGAEECADEIVPLLNSPDADIRSWAAMAMGTFRRIETLPRLVQLMNDPETCGYAASALGWFGDSGHRALLPFLAHDNDDIANAALVELVRISAIPVVAGALAESNAVMRRAAALILSRLQTPLAMWLLSTRLHDDDVAVRRIVMETLKEWDELTEEMVAEALEDEDPLVRASALVPAAERFSMWESLRPRLCDENAGVRRMAAVLYAGPDAVEALVPLLEDDDSQVVAAAADRIASQDGGAPIIAKMIMAPEEWRRTAASMAVNCLIDVPAFVRELVKGYESQDAAVRARVVAVAARLATEELDAVLLRAVADPSADVRHAAREVLLGRVGVDLFEKLIPHLSSADEELRFGAVFVLAHAGPVELLDMLTPLQSDRSPRIRRAVVRALERSRESEEESLTRLANDDDGGVRAAAMMVLIQNDSQQWVPRLLEAKGPLFAMNALRHPSAWELVRATTRSYRIPRDLSGMLSDCCGPIAGPLEHADSDALTLVEGLEAALIASGFDLILEEDSVRVVSREEARLFWMSWWKEKTR